MRAQLRRRWKALTAATALLLAGLNVGWREGGFVLLILALAFGGVCLAVLVPGWVAGTSVVRHSLQAERDIAVIEARRRRELTR